MRKTIKYKVNNKEVERQINYIPIRYVIAILITIFEILAIIGIVIVCCIFIPYFYVAAFLTQVFCVLRIVSGDENPDYKVPWLLVVLVIPVAGFMLYFIFSSRKLKKKFIKRLDEIKLKDYQRDDKNEFEMLRGENIDAANDAKMLTKIADTHLFKDTECEYFPLGEDMHKRMLEDLRGAKKFIFMEYFIIERGVFWDSILEILEAKAKEGVEIKVVYDDIGCMSTLPVNYYKILKKKGIEATPFSRLRGNADSEFNNRSHRKITVIDGYIGYTGGVNIADEYINERVRFGHWKDVGLRLEGEAAWELTRLFISDYSINVKQMPEIKEHYYPKCENAKGSGYIVPFGDGPRPLYERRVGKGVIKNMLAGAKRYTYIMTPYLIIDNELCASLENAALRGVDVKIITPHIPDKKIVFGMTRSFYKRLMDAGVHIYEYTPGFVHAKVYLCDKECAMVGTINLDYRSLVHHFENGVWLYNTKCIEDIENDFLKALDKCTKIEKGTLKASVPKRIFRSIVRIFAPLL